MRQSVIAPVNSQNGFGHGATGLLILQRHAVGKTQQIDELFALEAAAVRETDFHLERIPR